MADTRQFTDHNEIGGVNVYLEDKKLAESPEQNTVATTDYVLLKDTDGVPHKISKANMMSVVKDALADLLKNNDLGTSVTKVPALNSSVFGSATVANLASLLGAANVIRVGSGNDMNNYKDISKKYIAPYDSSARDVLHSPFENSFYCDVIQTGENIFIQRATIYNGSQTKIRKCINGTWSEWE